MSTGREKCFVLKDRDILLFGLTRNHGDGTMENVVTRIDGPGIYIVIDD